MRIQHNRPVDIEPAVTISDQPPGSPVTIPCFTEDTQYRFGVLHYAYLPVLGYPVTCAPSPRGRLSRPPWCGVNRTTTMGTPSPWGSRPEC